MSLDNQSLDLSPIRTGGDDSVLAGIWRKILKDLEVDDTAIFERIDQYASKMTKANPDKASQIRGNLRTDVNKSGMTWFTFTKCLRVLGVDYFEIEFTLHHIRKKSKHTLRVKLEDNFFEKDKEDNSPSDLSVFFRHIQHELGIGLRKYEELLEDYMRREKLVVNLRNKTNIRGYLKKDFSSDKISWRTFMKAMVFLCVVKMDLKISLTFNGNNLSHHTYNVLLGDLEDYSVEMKNDLGI